MPPERVGAAVTAKLVSSPRSKRLSRPKSSEAACDGWRENAAAKSFARVSLTRVASDAGCANAATASAAFGEAPAGASFRTATTPPSASPAVVKITTTRRPRKAFDRIDNMARHTTVIGSAEQGAAGNCDFLTDLRAGTVVLDGTSRRYDRWPTSGACTRGQQSWKRAISSPCFLELRRAQLPGALDLISGGSRASRPTNPDW